MQRTRIQTDIDVSYFKEKVKVEEIILTGDPSSRYVYKISHKSIKYILKGFKVCLEYLDPENDKSVDLFGEGIGQISDVFQEYFFAKSACLFNPHIVKPLDMRHAIVPTKVKGAYSYMYIEMLFEDSGVPLNEIKSVDIETAYNFMRQSANALKLLHDIDIAHLDIKPANMVYSRDKDVLKIIDMGSAFGSPSNKRITDATESLEGKIQSGTREYAPPEVLRMGEVSYGSMKLPIAAVDVYYWAMCFYSIIANKDADGLAHEYRRYKLGSEKDYNDFMKHVERCIHLTKAKNSKEAALKDIIKVILSGALKYNPEERPAMKEVVSVMKNFEEARNIKIKYAETEESNKSLELRLKVCNSCSKWIKDEVKLNCEHIMCKDCLVMFVLEKFLEKQQYNHYCLCLQCNRLQVVRKIPLDCGCTWAKESDRSIALQYGVGCWFARKGIVKACNKGHKLGQIDYCLINDHVSLKSTFMMMYIYSKKRSCNVLLNLCSCALRKENIETIAWALRSTEAVTQLDLDNYGLNDSSIKILSEALKFNTTLMQLDLRKNKIGSAGAKAIGEALMVNKMLRQLCLYSNNIGDGGAEELCKALKVNTALTQLSLWNNQIKHEGAAEISKMLRVNKTLIKLNISNNKIGNAGAKAIAAVINPASILFGANETLPQLNLKDNDIDDEGGEAIFQALVHNKTIRQLNLRDNKIAYKSSEIIGQLLANNKKLTELNLRNNKIRELAMIHIGMGLKENDVLVELNLSGNKIGDIGAGYIADALITNTTLARLNLSKTKIRNEGAQLIGVALKINESLKELNLSNNKIKYIGAASIGEALKFNTALTQLYLVKSNINTEAAQIISEGLDFNRTLKILNLSKCKLDSSSTKMIAEALKRNKALIQLHLSKNAIDNGSAAAFGQMLKANSTLEELILSNNRIDSASTRFICEGLKGNRVLAHLQLSNNLMKDEGAKTISDMLKVNTSLTQLHLINNGIGEAGRKVLMTVSATNRNIELNY